MSKSAAYVDLGGQRGPVDYERRLENHYVALAASGFSDDDAATVLEPFSRLGVGLQTAEWLESPYVNAATISATNTKLARTAFAAEFKGLYGAINARYLTAKFEEDQPRTAALAGLLRQFRSDDGRMSLQEQRTSIYPRTVAAAVRLAKHRIAAAPLAAIKGTVSSGLPDTKAPGDRLPQLTILSEVALSNRAANLQLAIGRGALLLGQTDQNSTRRSA